MHATGQLHNLQVVMTSLDWASHDPSYVYSGKNRHHTMKGHLRNQIKIYP